VKIAVIGAGPAGLSCALELARKGQDVTVFEADTAVGGISRTISIWGMNVDYGPHRFFTMDKRVADFWIDTIRDDFILVDRLTRIFYKNKFFDYPLKPLNAFVGLGFIESLYCGFSYLKASIDPKKNEKSFADWVSNRFGQRLYEIFFKTYSEKLWGISCDELDADFAAQRIKGLNLYEAVKNALFKGKAQHKTLVEQFAYPRHGAGEVYERIADRFAALGGSVRLGVSVERLVIKDGRVSGLDTSEGFFACDEVVSTMPLTDIIEHTDAFSDAVKKSSRQLTYRNTTLVYLNIAQADIFKDNWIYVHANNLQTGRITNFRNWSPDMLHGKGEAILMLEYWSYDQDELWRMDDSALIDLARREITATGLVEGRAVGEGHVVRIHRSYPVYARGYETHLKVLQDAVDAVQGLTCIGRNGSFKYNNQDHSILMGLLAAENIADGARHDLWKINTDYDYQEGKSALNEERSK